MPEEVQQKIVQKVEAHRHELLKLVSELIKIRSVTGEEDAIQDYIEDWLRRAGLNTNSWTVKEEELRRHPAYPEVGLHGGERKQLVGLMKGGKRGRSLILNGHVDTVSPGKVEKWSKGPFSGTMMRGKIYGRGSSDMKGALAAMMLAMRSILDAGYEPGGPVIFEPVIGEEAGGAGTLSCVQRGYRADAALIGEPSRMNFFLAQAGSLKLRIKVEGKSAHSAMKNRGVSAFEKSVLIYEALMKLEADRIKKAKHPLFAEYDNPCPIVLGKSVIGEWYTNVPEEAVLEGRVGTLAGEKADEVQEEVELAMKKVVEADRWMKEHQPRLEWFGIIRPSEVNSLHPFVKAVKGAYETVLQRSPRFSASTFGADMRILSIYQKTPCFMFGPGDISVAHAPDEFVPVEEVIDACKIYALSIARWCGVG